MKYLLIEFLSFFLTKQVKSQRFFDLGLVRYDSLFNCTDSASLRFNDKRFGVSDICESGNEIEIRLKLYYRPGSSSDLFIFSFNKEKWDVRKFKLRGGYLGQELTTTIYTNLNQSYLGTDQTCSWILNQLIANKIFSLPDQHELNHEQIAFDGLAILISFKVRDKFRRYWYENPESYCEAYPGAIEYPCIVEIIKTIKSL